MSDQEMLAQELKALLAQREEAVASLNRIDGAISMCRHLLARAHRTREEQRLAQEAASNPTAGQPADSAT